MHYVIPKRVFSETIRLAHELCTSCIALFRFHKHSLQVGVKYIRSSMQF